MTWREILNNNWIMENSFYLELQQNKLVRPLRGDAVALALLAGNICCVSSFIKDGAPWLELQKDKWKRFHNTGMSPEQEEDMIHAHNLIHPKYYAILEELPLKLYVKYNNSGQIVLMQKSQTTSTSRISTRAPSPAHERTQLEALLSQL
jgi:hypothetical protein